jgi:peptidoglycan/xylan/chitin deacetylase (PgdA/CDA1 family)
VDKRYVALTFDDGPNPGSTRALLAALKAGGAKATFFIWGEHAVRHPDHLRALSAAGMWIGNHGFTHRRLTRLGRRATHDELAKTQRAIGHITGRTPTLFRPPYGDTDAEVGSTAAALGLTETLWTVDTRDWAGAGTGEIADAAATVQPGGIILMHDNGYLTTVDAVPFILRMMADRGLAAGRIDEKTGRAVAPRQPSRTPQYLSTVRPTSVTLRS